jgi:hypothetical protein
MIKKALMTAGGDGPAAIAHGVLSYQLFTPVID